MIINKQSPNFSYFTNTLIQDKLLNVQAIINCPYSIAQMFTQEEWVPTQ